MKVSQFLNDYSKILKNKEGCLFIGAGATIESGMPLWGNITDEILSNLGINKNDLSFDLINQYGLENTVIAQYYQNQIGKHQFNAFLSSHLENKYKDNNLLNELLKLPFKNIWTTNFDDAIEKELIRMSHSYISLYHEDDMNQIFNYDNIIYKVNGTRNHQKDLVFTKENFEKIRLSRAKMLEQLKRALITKSFLFVGYSFNDRVVLDCIAEIKSVFENLPRHYCFMERKQIGTIEEKLQDLKIEELKRYNIHTVLINKFSYDLPRIYDNLQKLIRFNNIFISGSNFKNDENTNFLLKQLSLKLFEKGYKIINGFGYGIGNLLIETIIETENNIHRNDSSYYTVNFDKYICVRPFPLGKRNLYPQYRKNMISQVQNCIFIGGAEFKFDAQNPQKLESGMYDEYLIAKQYNRNILPICNSGFQAKRIYTDEIKNDKLLPEFPCSISDSNSIEKTVNIIINYLNEQRIKLLTLNDLD